MHIQAQRGVVNALVYVIKLIFQLSQHLLSLSLAVERELDIASLRNFKPVAAYVTLHSVLQPMRLHSQQMNSNADRVSNSYGCQQTGTYKNSRSSWLCQIVRLSQPCRFGCRRSFFGWFQSESSNFDLTDILQVPPPLRPKRATPATVLVAPPSNLKIQPLHSVTLPQMARGSWAGAPPFQNNSRPA